MQYCSAHILLYKIGDSYKVGRSQLMWVLIIEKDTDKHPREINIL